MQSDLKRQDQDCGRGCTRGQRHRIWLLLAGLAGLGAAQLIPAGHALAQQSRDVYMGSTNGRSGPYGAPTQPPQYQMPTGRPRQPSETDGLLEDALDDLSRGRLLEARRLLELVIERFAGTPSADEARRLLAPIYASGRGPGQPAPPPLQPADQALNRGRSDIGQEEPVRGDFGRRTPLLPAAASIPDRDPAERQWQTEVRRVRALDQDFRANVGDRIFFGEASIDIGSRSRVVLAAQAAWLKRYPDVTITVEAHADDQGGPEFNRELAARRAEAVRARLIEEGMEPSRIHINPVGREKPVATCADAACTAQNRRAVIQLLEPERRASVSPDTSLEAGRRN